MIGRETEKEMTAAVGSIIKSCNDQDTINTQFQSCRDILDKPDELLRLTILKLLSHMNTWNGKVWICLLHEAAVEGKHKTIQSFATCAMINIVQKTAIIF